MPVVEIDAQMRMWRIMESSREALDRLEPQLLSNDESYAAGIRHWMAKNPGRVPDWAPVDISAADIVAVPRAGLWTSYQAGLGVRDCRRGGVNLMPGQDGSGDPWSNEWAVVPERSATGGAILLTDPHGGMDGRFTHEYRLHAGKTPVRPDGDVDWLMPVDGNTSATAWLGIHPLDELLVVERPAAGYLQNNNVDPRLMDVPPPTDLEAYPAYILDGGMVAGGVNGSRSQRAVELLSTTDRMTREEALEIALDEYWSGTNEWLRVLGGALELSTPPDEAAGFTNELLAFDGYARTESTAALKYVYWREALRKELTVDDFQTLMGPLWSGEELPTDLAPKMVAAVDAAYRGMLENHGGLEVAYGAEFHVGGDPGRSWPLGGGTVMDFSQNECSLDPLMCPITLRAFYYLPRNEDGIRLAAGGSRMLRLDYYSPEGIEPYTAHNPGHSDVADSVHTDDQAEKLMSARKLKKVHFLWSELEEHVVSERILVIPGSP